VKKVYDYKFKT